MTKIAFSKTVPALLERADALLVVAPSAAFARGKWIGALGDDLGALARKLGKRTEPGVRGSAASTLGPGKLELLHVGVLPDRLSRYNSPSRADSISAAVKASKIGEAQRPAVLLVLDDATHALAACNAVAKALPALSLKSTVQQPVRLRIAAVTRAGEPVAIDAAAKAVVAATRAAARLVDTPPTDLNPTAYAREAKKLLRGLPHVTVEEIRGDALLRAKLGGVHAVGRCAVEPPRVLVAKHTPPRVKGAPIALVGKGITYDTGGLHLKARGSMETMKGDMGGSAAVLGAFRALVESGGLDRRLVLVLCLAENAIGARAYKPDDVLTMHSGRTVEINNTDAEGRLLLADGVSYAARVLGADTIIDAATLTGAQLVATGLVHAAVVSNDAALERAAVDAGSRSGDLCHPLPFAPELYKHEFRSPIADMRNSVKNRSNAQSSCAAEFVHWHIEDTDAKWLHVDLAGPAMIDDRGTGFGVALLAELVRAL